MHLIQTILFISTLVSVIFCFKFPSDITRCHAGDEECILKTANEVIAKHGKVGHSGINMIPIDPLHVPLINLKQGADNTPVNAELTFIDVDFIGIHNFKLVRISGFNKDPNGKYLIRAKGDQLSLVGPYKIAGRVLILPVVGEGMQNLTMSDVEFELAFDGKSYMRNNKEYLRTENATFTFSSRKIHFNFENLYKGDKFLGDATNLFLNENWNDIFEEIKQSLFEACALIADNAVSNIFNKVPYKDLFLED